MTAGVYDPVMVTTAPPTYAWDWFARQRLLWREARTRLVASPSTASGRYADLEGRSEVVAQLRADYPVTTLVADTVDGIVRDLAFLGRTTDASFDDLGVRLPPRGMRWWWEHLTGEPVGAPPSVADRRAAADAQARRQLSLEDVLEGYGD